MGSQVQGYLSLPSPPLPPLPPFPAQPVTAGESIPSSTPACTLTSFLPRCRGDTSLHAPRRRAVRGPETHAPRTQDSLTQELRRSFPNTLRLTRTHAQFRRYIPNSGTCQGPTHKHTHRTNGHMWTDIRALISHRQCPTGAPHCLQLLLPGPLGQNNTKGGSWLPQPRDRAHSQPRNVSSVSPPLSRVPTFQNCR